MLIARGLLVLCGLGLSAPALAQQTDAAFEYSPVARLLQNGQYRAEVWRRDVTADRGEIAWSDAEPTATAATAIAEACTALTQNFDPAFHCPRAVAAPSQEGVALKPSATAVPNKLPLPVGKAPPALPGVGKAPPALPGVVKAGAHPPSPAVMPGAPATTPAPPTGGSGWARDFWQSRDRTSAGGGGSE